MLNDKASQRDHVDITAKYGLLALAKELLNAADHVDEIVLEYPLDQAKLTLAEVDYEVLSQQLSSNRQQLGKTSKFPPP
ncbi:hypothetical protein HOY82DRAFT_604794 [Tuber indicum]|nr:hypothetical protein HOY82DRAFT_604794 [Tuber indicum]